MGESSMTVKTTNAMKYFKNILTISLVLLVFTALAQNSDSARKQPMNVGGYLKDMQSLWIDNKGKWLSDNLLHNRLNFSYELSSKAHGYASMRNRLFFGEITALIPGYDSILSKDDGFVDLSWVPANGNNWIFHTTVDRLYIDVNSGKWQFIAGRQRINWGIGLMWNPNDIFNAFSFFDFDYEERPGTDAILVKYYSGAVSSAEMAYSPGKTWKTSTLAGLYKFNIKGYDIQTLAGYAKDDWTLGTGWSGNLGQFAFRGEATYFHPNSKNIVDSFGVVTACLSVDRTFSKGMFLHSGILIVSNGSADKISPNAFSLTQNNISAKSLSPSRYTLFLQGMYPFSPIVSASMAIIVNPCDGSFFAGPTCSLSLSDNAEIMLALQSFIGKENTAYGGIGNLVFIRFKQSF